MIWIIAGIIGYVVVAMIIFAAFKPDKEKFMEKNKNKSYRYNMAFDSAEDEYASEYMWITFLSILWGIALIVLSIALLIAGIVYGLYYLSLGIYYTIKVSRIHYLIFAPYYITMFIRTYGDKQARQQKLEANIFKKENEIQQLQDKLEAYKSQLTEKKEGRRAITLCCGGDDEPLP